MKNYKTIIDSILVFGLGIFTLIAIFPENLGMPSGVEMASLAILSGLLATFLVVFWREKPTDEREVKNQASASRLAYIAGTSVLIVFLIIESLNHDLSPVIPITIFVMIATKLFSQKYLDNS